MRGNSIIMLVIALVFGAVAVVVANIWLGSQTKPVQQATVAPATVETSTIVVAARDLSFGEALSSDVLREIPWPKASIPDGSYAKVADLTDASHIVLTSISPNEPILKWKISGAGARASLSAAVTPGMRAVALRINDIAGVAGFVLPGDRVDLLYTRTASGGESATTDVLLQNVRVLAIDQVADQKKSDPMLAKVATLEVAPLDGQKIALAQSTGALSLALRSAGSVDPAPAQRVVEKELVSSPSVYQAAIDAQNAEQSQLEARIKSIEGQLGVSKSDPATSAKLSELEAKLKSISTAPKPVAVATETPASKPSGLVPMTIIRGVKAEIVQVFDENASR